MSSGGYEQQFNKQLSQHLKQVRTSQPNHIPVYAMKYKNASKYLVQDLIQSLALFPKKFKLKKIYDVIEAESQRYCIEKLSHDSKVKEQGQNFRVPEFYLYTIDMLSQQQRNKMEEKQTIENIIKRKQPSNAQRPIGKFVRLDLQLTYQQAFENYGRQNVLTIVYTDATQVSRQQSKENVSTAEKWLTRIVIIVLLLVLVPYLMTDDSTKLQAPTNFIYNETTHLPSQKGISPEDTVQFENYEDVQTSETEVPNANQQKIVSYEDGQF